MKSKTTPWNKIKVEYLEGATPKELGLKYQIKPKVISDRFSGMGVVEEKRIISKEIQENVKVTLEGISTLSIKRLKELLNRDDIKPNELIAAIRLGFDITLLNKNKADDEEGMDTQKAFIDSLRQMKCL